MAKKQKQQPEFDVLDSLQFLTEVLQNEEKTETPEEAKLGEAGAALRSHTNERNQKAFENAAKAVGNQQYGSTRYLAGAVISLVTDVAYCAHGVLKNMLDSPLVKELIAEEAGEGKTLTDLLVEKFGNDAKTRKELRSAFKRQSELEKYVRNLADYSAQVSKTPGEVLRTPSDAVEVIKQTYGSLAKYENKVKKVTKSNQEVVTKLDQLQKIPVGFLVEAALSKRLGDLSDIGLNPIDVSRFAQDYIKEVLDFAKAYITESAKAREEQLQVYKSVAN